MADAWSEDRLGYEKIGSTFANLVQSITEQKVISIEAGFGRGKTFFRKAWAEQLRSTGEIVVEVDVQQSDHSGDPVVTLLGALVDALPVSERGKGSEAFSSAKKLGAIGARTVARVVLKAGAEELIEAMSEKAIDALDDFDALDDVIKNVGEGMSKVAGQMIASQMAAEKVRKLELPQQLDALRQALVKEAKTERVVVIVDELDRCHPEYAISFLEAMKLVFYQSGFVFCLMVNADYLENLARHRFGVPAQDERYLDKFVDIRLRLAPKDDMFKLAVVDLARELPLKTPYGDGEEFSVGHAAELAGALADHTKFSFRKIKRILLKVETALRCYADRPLDTSLLVFMAFNDEVEGELSASYLPRSFLTPQKGVQVLSRVEQPEYFKREHQIDADLNKVVYENCKELFGLPRERYGFPDGSNYKDWSVVFEFLAPKYIPFHREILNGVALFVDDAE